MISTRNLSLLPEIDALRATMQAMAMLDAILSPEWQYRYYSFNSVWAPGMQMGSMRNSSGDDLFARFSPAGCWLKGFAHEHAMSPFRANPVRPWPGVLDGVPEEFADCLREPAFSVENVTFCIWRHYHDNDWQIGPVQFPRGDPDPDGSEYLLTPLDGRPETYRNWAQDYYEQDVDLSAVEHVYRHRPLTTAVLERLNPRSTLSSLAADIREIGYIGTDET